MEREGIAGKDEGAIPVTNGTSIAPSEGHGVGDINASTGYNMEDTLLENMKNSKSVLMASAKAQKVSDEGWMMQDGTPWPRNNTRGHPGMIQVFLGHSGRLDAEGNELPLLVCVS